MAPNAKQCWNGLLCSSFKPEGAGWWRHSSAGGECVPSLHVHGVFSLAKLQCHWDAGANLTLYGCSLKVGVV